MSGKVAKLQGVHDLGMMPLDGLNQPMWIDHLALGTGVAKAYTVPTGATKLIFLASFDFYVNYVGVAVVPTGDVVDGTGAEFNPGGIRLLDSTTTAISIIAAAGGMMTILAYF